MRLANFGGGFFNHLFSLGHQFGPKFFRALHMGPENAGVRCRLVNLLDDFSNRFSPAHTGREIKDVFIGRIVKDGLDFVANLRHISVGSVNNQGNGAFSLGAFP
ncbi:MAG: hypothetical protein KCHDKBKB_02400 [Elusimicrobia bacterium]|nr:hypothetical protein [Elusimicrobiota bacterium]